MMAEPEVKVSLAVMDGPDEGASFELHKSRTTLGRRGTTIRLNDLKASLSHAVIDIEGSEVHITDLNSRNGLFVNGEKVKRVRLSSLDEIRIGLTKLRVMIVEDLKAFRRRNSPAEAGKTPTQDHRDIGAMIDEELKQFSRWDLSDPSVEAITSGDVMAAVRSYGLQILEGPEAGRKFRIDKRIMSLGRSNTDIFLNDVDVSRLHAEIEVLSDGNALLRDLGSTNGTFVNGKKTMEIRLKPEDRIKVGNTLIRFVSNKA